MLSKFAGPIGFPWERGKYHYIGLGAFSLKGNLTKGMPQPLHKLCAEWLVCFSLNLSWTNILLLKNELNEVVEKIE